MRSKNRTFIGAASLLVALVSPVSAQDPVPPAETLIDAFPAQEHYSPYAGRNFPTQVFWGDTHLHTALSMDAGACSVRGSPLRTPTASRVAKSSPPRPASVSSCPGHWTS